MVRHDTEDDFVAVPIHEEHHRQQIHFRTCRCRCQRPMSPPSSAIDGSVNRRQTEYLPKVLSSANAFAVVRCLANPRISPVTRTNNDDDNRPTATAAPQPQQRTRDEHGKTQFRSRFRHGSRSKPPDAKTVNQKNIHPGRNCLAN